MGAQYKAMEECGKYGQFSTLPAPSNNPFTTLPGDASNPWTNVPQPIDSRRSPLSKLLNRGSNLQNSDKWTNLWSDFLNVSVAVLSLVDLLELLLLEVGGLGKLKGDL